MHRAVPALDIHAGGQLVAEESYSGAPTDAQQFLVISEIMYNPEVPDAEYIELTNISDSVTLDLAGAAFTEGIVFEFPAGFSLAPGERTLVVYNQASPDSRALAAFYVKARGMCADCTRGLACRSTSGGTGRW